MIKFTDPKVANKVFWGLVTVCALLVVIDVGLYFFHGRHTHFAGEEIPGIYGVFGFIAFWCIVIAGKYFRKLVKRDEDYYDE